MAVDLTRIAEQEASNFAASRARAIYVQGGPEKERYRFCDLIRECLGGKTFVWGEDPGGRGADLYVIDFGQITQAAA
jgi:hypothetical protein